MQISNNLCQVMTRYFLVIGNWLISKLLWIDARVCIHGAFPYKRLKLTQIVTAYM